VKAHTLHLMSDHPRHARRNMNEKGSSSRRSNAGRETSSAIIRCSLIIRMVPHTS
jgi:hypothetical protein